jgi:tetratricopeptide (TPR) repeat protein
MNKTTTIIIMTVSIIAAIALLNKQKSYYGAKANAVQVLPRTERPQLAVDGRDPFYGIYDRAIASINVGNYDEAITLLNQALEHIGMGLEKGMVYKRLAEIYKVKGDLNKELYYAEEFPKYSMNKELNQQFLQRAAEIRQILASERTGPP